MGGRHMCCHKQKLKKGLWSPEEDEKLVRCITKHGHGRWSAVPKLADLERCGKSCRLRWINYLRPDLKRGTFSESEENLIIELHSALGNRWSQIAARLPGRTDNEIKNFWNSCVKKKMKKMGIDPNTHKPIAEPEIPVACRAENSTDSSIMDSPNMELTVANQSNLSHDSHETLLSPREAINCCNPLAEVSHHDPSLPSSSPSFTKIFKTAHIIDNCSSNPQLWLHQNESSNAQDTHGLANESSSSSSYPAAAQDNSSNNAHMAVAYPFTVPEMKQLDAAAAFQLIAAPCDPISSDKMPLLNHEGMPMMNYCENGQLWEQQDKNQAFAIHMGPSNQITASSSSSSVSVSSHASSLKWPEFLEQQPLPAATWALQSPSQHPSSEDIQRLAAVLDQTH